MVMGSTMCRCVDPPPQPHRVSKLDERPCADLHRRSAEQRDGQFVAL